MYPALQTILDTIRVLLCSSVNSSTSTALVLSSSRPPEHSCTQLQHKQWNLYGCICVWLYTHSRQQYTILDNSANTMIQTTVDLSDFANTMIRTTVIVSGSTHTTWYLGSFYSHWHLHLQLYKHYTGAVLYYITRSSPRSRAAGMKTVSYTHLTLPTKVNV